MTNHEDRVAPRTAQQVEFRLGSFVHQMHPTKTLPEKEALQLHALLSEYRAAVEAEAASLDSDELRKATLRPCHVTGMHTPDHHLTSDHVCSIQAEDIAKRLLEGIDLASLPRELHVNCYWCGTSKSQTPTSKADAQAQWALLSAGDKAEAPPTPERTETHE